MNLSENHYTDFKLEKQEKIRYFTKKGLK